MQTLALLSKIALNLGFVGSLQNTTGILQGHFDVSKCLDKTILEHFNAFYERKSQIEVN